MPQAGVQHISPSAWPRRPHYTADIPRLLHPSSKLPPSKAAAFKVQQHIMVHISNWCTLIKHGHGRSLHSEGEARSLTTASAHFGRDACPPREHHPQTPSLFRSLARTVTRREQTDPGHAA